MSLLGGGVCVGGVLSMNIGTHISPLEDNEEAGAGAAIKPGEGIQSERCGGGGRVAAP